MSVIMTPWGVADSSDLLTDGVVLHSTPSHGGFILSPEKNEAIDERWRRQDRAYEEDCEAHKVVLTFPELFTPGAVALAKRAAERWFPEPFKAIYGGQG